MSQNFIFIDEVLYGDYAISLYTNGSAIDISDIQYFLNNLEQGISPRDITDLLISSFEQISKIDILNEGSIVLITEIESGINE